MVVGIRGKRTFGEKTHALSRDETWQSERVTTTDSRPTCVDTNEKGERSSPDTVRKKLVSLHNDVTSLHFPRFHLHSPPDLLQKPAVQRAFRVRHGKNGFPGLVIPHLEFQLLQVPDSSSSRVG